ncbi:MAG: hypothetical protein QGH27_00975, partial [SAR324 cluster bacterium]|nr:hypothetical protein [SAR324 cluster bacterium]
MASQPDLTNIAISSGYATLIHTQESGGVSGVATNLYDGDGTLIPISVSTSVVSIIDGAYDFDIASHDGSNGLKLGGTLVTSSAVELNYLDVSSIGTAQASKALVLDANSDLTGIRHLTGTGTATFAQFTATGDVSMAGDIAIGDSASDSVTFTADVNSNIIPNTNDAYDLGSSSQAWRDIYLTESIVLKGGTGENTVALVDNLANALDFTESSNSYMNFDTTNSGEKIVFSKELDINAVSDFGSNAMTNVNVDSGAIDGTPIGANSANTGAFTTLSATGDVDLGNATSDTITATGYFDSNLIPSADDTYDLGSSSNAWQDLFLEGDITLSDAGTITTTAGDLTINAGSG